MDLRGGCSDRALFECLRRNRAGVPEGVLPEATGADPVGAAISGHADRGDGDLHRARHSRSAEVSSARDAGREVNPVLKPHRAETRLGNLGRRCEGARL